MTRAVTMKLSTTTDLHRVPEAAQMTGSTAEPSQLALLLDRHRTELRQVQRTSTLGLVDPSWARCAEDYWQAECLRLAAAAIASGVAP